MYGGSGQCFNVDQLEISKYFQPNQLHLLTVNFKFLESTLTLNMPGIGIELGLWCV